jgi:ribosomal-protein-alanine N-acetyltransferase
MMLDDAVNISIDLQTTGHDLSLFEQQANTCTWTQAQFQDSLDHGCLCINAKKDHQWLGYCLISQQFDVIEILHLSVHPDERRKKIAHRLLNLCLDYAKNHAMAAIWLEVRASNVAAIALYQQMGFTKQGIRKQYYPCEAGGKEDAILMNLILTD